MIIPQFFSFFFPIVVRDETVKKKHSFKLSADQNSMPEPNKLVKWVSHAETADDLGNFKDEE